MSNIISAVNLKEPGRLSVTYTPERAANMARHVKYKGLGDSAKCHGCGQQMKKLTTYQNRKDEFFCTRCDISIPLYE